MNRFLREKALECVFVADFFRIMNNTMWNLHDDDFYVVNRRWFDNWKQYISYDYIVHSLLEKKVKGPEKQFQERLMDLSINQIMNNSKVRPPPVANRNILMESRKYFQRLAGEDLAPLFETAVMDRDYILICRGLWNYFKTFYGGQTIRRYAIERDKSGRLYRNVMLPFVKVVVMKRGEKLKPPKFVVANFRTPIVEFKKQLKETFY